MILVDIYVPAVDQSYDFSLDERAQVSDIIEELVEMISQKERTTLIGDIHRLTLCDRLNRAALPKDCSLASCGIGNGSSMMLL